MTTPDKRLIYTVDDNYAIPFLVSAYSAWKHYSEKICITIVQPLDTQSRMGFSKEALSIVERSLQVLGIKYEVVHVNVNTFPEDQLPLWARFPRTTWLRYYFVFNTELTDEIYFYVEPDMLFVSDKPNLIEVELHETAIAARTTPDHHDFEDKWNKELDKPWYFNCGVMVLNVKAWRSKISQRDWWELVSKHEAFRFSVIEQDALNYVFQGAREELPKGINVYPAEFQENRDSLLHFAGQFKPWNFSPKFLRKNLSQRLIFSMSLWDESQKELLSKLSSELTSQEYKSALNLKPRVKLTTKLNIIYPRLTAILFNLNKHLMTLIKR